MHGKRVLILGLFFLIFSLLIQGFKLVELKASDSYPVHNLDTGLNYTAIQDAIDANETLDGHTILVEEGTYYEHVEISKSVSLVGENRQATIIDGNGTERVVRITASYVSIGSFTIRNSGLAPWGEGYGGIYLGDNSSGNIIRGNTITNGSGGIEMSRSRNNVIQNNVVSNNWKFGMDLYDSAENIIDHNTIADNAYGISFDFGSTRNEVYDNIILSNVFGVYLNYAPQNTFRNNTLTDNVRGLGLGLASGLEDFDQDIDTSNSINGKPVCYLVKQRDILVDPSAFPNGVGYVGIVGSENVTVRDLSVSGNCQGVLLACTKDSRLQNITVSNCIYGLHIEKSTENAAVDCRLYGTYGVWLVESDENLIYNNTISDTGVGIWLYFNVSGNILSRNNVTSCAFGITSYPCYNNSVTKNVVSNCSSGISLHGSDNTITENNVSYCEYGGIDIRLSNFTVVSDNVLTHNGMGIWVAGGSGGGSDFNIVSGNTLILNEHGFDVRNCRGNIFYHNNVINNTVQSYLADTDNVWDRNGEGNYWSDYNGTDSNHDGIGDTPYTIDANNTDNYPLMGMFYSVNITFLPGSTVTLISNSTISYFHVVTVIESIETSKGIFTIFINFTDQAGYGFCRVSIPHALMNISNTPVTIDHGFTTVLNPNYMLYDNGTQRWIYFAYEHSTPPLNQTGHFPARIMIIPEFPSFLILPLFIIATLLAVIIYRKKYAAQLHP